MSLLGYWKTILNKQKELGWGANITLMDTLKNNDERIWYARKAIENGWSSNILDLQIKSDLYKREGKARLNIDKQLEMLDMLFKI